MSRPNKKGLDYFPHDTNAFFDEKIQALRQVFGNDGYTTYFVLLELAYKNGGYYDLNSKFTRVLVSMLGIDKERFDKIINECIELELFENDNGIITSRRIIEQVEAINKKRFRWRQKISKESETELIENPETDEEKIVNAFLRIFGKLPTMYERSEMEQLVKQYGIDKIISSMEKAKLQNKCAISYIKAIVLKDSGELNSKLKKIQDKLGVE